MLRSNVKLVLEPGAGARLVDDQGQRSVTLTATEGRIVALIAPGATAESLAAAAKGAGLDVDAAQVEALLTRLRANELGFTVARCDDCKESVLVAFEVLPRVGYRQWTLSLPFALRFLMVKEPKLLRQVERRVVRAPRLCCRVRAAAGRTLRGSGARVRCANRH